ncbi:MAG: putative 7-carboxy-7-deazaguanine synthase QueE [Lachnospiraceae bacterium]
MNLKVVEKFVSINGEGVRAGQPAVFLRFAGCNLNCIFCDTKWANEADVSYESESPEQLVEYVVATGITNVTLTGGEPLLQEGIGDLIRQLLAVPQLQIEIETNGSIDLSDFLAIRKGNQQRLTVTMDYKLPFSQMEKHMKKNNFSLISREDTVKFVVADETDLAVAKKVIEDYGLISKTQVYISPVFGEIELTKIVDFLIENKLNGVNMQLQMHKFIWDPNQKGV